VAQDKITWTMQYDRTADTTASRKLRQTGDEPPVLRSGWFEGWVWAELGIGDVRKVRLTIEPADD